MLLSPLLQRNCSTTDRKCTADSLELDSQPRPRTDCNTSINSPSKHPSKMGARPAKPCLVVRASRNLHEIHCAESGDRVELPHTAHEDNINSRCVDWQDRPASLPTQTLIQQHILLTKEPKRTTSRSSELETQRHKVARRSILTRPCAPKLCQK